MVNALKNLIDTDESKKKLYGFEYTPVEIYRQVQLWEETYSIFNNNIKEIKNFIYEYMNQSNKNIILTGAGTSEFIGTSIEGLIRKNFSVPTNVFSTTRIITHPSNIILKGYNTLFISFARSGNSPESIGAVYIADRESDSIKHLCITCNSEGELYKLLSKKTNSYCILLNPQTNDRGLAMTSSFTNMVIAGQMLSFINKWESYRPIFENMIKAGNNLLNSAPDIIEEISRIDFNRAVFLVDGNNTGTAIESHLKLQELTNGRVMCTYDTFAGLRHGPEAVIDNNTIIVAYISPDRYIRQYEIDLLREIKNKKIGKLTLICTDNFTDDLKELSDYAIEYAHGESLDIPDDMLPPVYVIIGQLLGLFKSINLGLKPDNPSEDGVINRVVKGVKVYDPFEYRKSGRFKVISER